MCSRTEGLWQNDMLSGLFFEDGVDRQKIQPLGPIGPFNQLGPVVLMIGSGDPDLPHKTAADGIVSHSPA